MDYDYIIVGAGSAGCVTANRLVQEYGKRVLLLEAGPLDTGMLLRMPAGTFKMLFGGSPFIKRYVSDTQPSLGGRTVSVPQGHVVGGGSSVNAMAYVRGSRLDYERWNEAIGGEGWGWDDLLPYFKRQEGNQHFDNEAHGGDGPLKVSDGRYIVEAADLFVRTMQKMGLPFTADFNAGELSGVGYMQTTTDRGERCSAATAFLKPIMSRSNLTVITEATVNRLLFDGERVVGVEYQANGMLKKAHAKAEVILAAGVYATPRLLMLSGIGPAAHLAEHGIDVRVDSPGVGQNLQDHNTVVVSMRTSGAYGYFGADKGLRMLVNGLRYLAFRDGPVASNGAETMAFVNLQDPQADPDLQLYGVGVMWPDPAGGELTHGISLMANLVKPCSRGTVRLRSADPKDDALINPNWLSDPSDQFRLLQAMKYLRRIAATAPLSEVISDECQPGSAVQSDEQLLAYMRRTTESNYHPCGTCKMGMANDPMAVLTPDLRVKGVTGLRVFDASMMPSVISANTNATVMAVADRAVDIMMGKAVGAQLIQEEKLESKKVFHGSPL
jgi:choline dehydrogenase